MSGLPVFYLMFLTVLTEDGKCLYLCIYFTSLAPYVGLKLIKIYVVNHTPAC